MKQLEVTAQDRTALSQVLAALKSGKWTLECEEILAFSQAVGWALRLDARLKLALEAPDAPITPQLPRGDTPATTNVVAAEKAPTALGGRRRRVVDK